LVGLDIDDQIIAFDGVARLFVPMSLRWPSATDFLEM